MRDNRIYVHYSLLTWPSSEKRGPTNVTLSKPITILNKNLTSAHRVADERMTNIHSVWIKEEGIFSSV